MLGYITAEDVLGDTGPGRKGPRPLHTMPTTLSALYDMGMRHHVRPAVMLWARSGGFEAVPDWRLDRLVIRVALFARERLGLAPGGCLAVIGESSWLWPVVDFAAMGFGASSLGIEHDVADEALAGALAARAPAAVFAADTTAAARLLALRLAGGFSGTVVVPEGVAPDGDLSLGHLLDLAATLDTPERAQAFRLVSRGLSVDAAALWHVGAGGAARLSHREAMALVAPGLLARPAQPGDVAYIEAPRASLGVRLALASFAGDGLTTTALGRSGGTSEDVLELRPHKMRVGRAWLEAACEGLSPRWPLGLDRGRAGRRVRERLGDRMRWVETDAGTNGATQQALDAAGVALVPGDGTGRPAAP
jgi:hypothetical protein